MDLFSKDGNLSSFGSPAGSSGPFDDDDVGAEMFKPSKPSASVIRGQKRKSISDMVRDESELMQITWVKIAEVQAKEKMECEKFKQQAFAEVELKHLQFQWEEGEKQHAHELMMMDWQIELERLKALMAGRIGPFIPDTNIDPSLHG